MIRAAISWCAQNMRSNAGKISLKIPHAYGVSKILDKF